MSGESEAGPDETESASPPLDHPLAEAIEDISSVAAIVGPTGDLLFTNPAWRAQRGGEPGSPGGEGAYYLPTRPAAADPDPFVEEVNEAVELLLAGDQDYFRTTYPGYTDGESHWFDVLAWRFEAGCEPHVLMLHMDVTTRTEAELSEREELERLESLSRVLAHDLRNSVSIAQGYAGLLADDVDSPYVSKLEDALRRIGTTVENAVFIARGTSVEHSGTVDLESLARRCWQGLDDGDATLRVSGEPVVEGDRGLVEELLENLFRNALDHAGSDPEVVLGERDDGAGFYVADDGPGIPEDEHERIFETGYSSSGENSGFGLDIVSRIAEAHGWTVTVEESEAGGARFTVETGED